ncbi:MAG: transposase [Acidobacteriota bacterium]
MADAQALDLLFACSYKTDWHAYAKPPFGGPEHVLAYLASYTHRIAISNGRILSFDGQHVTFSWRDYARHNADKTMELDAVEFLRRFLQHVLPPRFTRVRYYGFLANRDRAANVAAARELIASRRPIRTRPPIPDPRLCPQMSQGDDASYGAGRSSMRPYVVRHLMNAAMTCPDLFVRASSSLRRERFVSMPERENRARHPRSRPGTGSGPRPFGATRPDSVARTSPCDDFSCPPTQRGVILFPRGPRLRPTELITASGSLLKHVHRPHTRLRGVLEFRAGDAV